MPNGPVDDHGGGESASASTLRLQILGPLRVWRDDVELDAGPRQQGYLLALLLARVGRVSSTSELVDLLWGEDAPVSALNVLHKYIGALRRLIEPSLPARKAGSHLLRRGNGYVFTADASELDLLGFRDLTTAADAALSQHHLDRALDLYAAALRLWTGPAGAGLHPAPAAIPIFAGLDDEFFSVCTVAADLAVQVGRPEHVLAAVRRAAVLAPLHEPVQAALIALLGAAGRQVEALSAFRAVRTRLAEELGLDPGPALEDAHRRVLNATLRTAERGPTEPFSGLVGRRDELALLRQAVHAAVHGRTGLVVVEGEPGVGKTRLLQEIADEAGAGDAAIVWGRCLEGDGTPSMWPWLQVVNGVLRSLPAALAQKWRTGDLGRLTEPRDIVLAGAALVDTGAQFRLFEEVVALVGEVSAQRPLLIVIDDLHWADIASLQLFTHLAARLPGGAVVVGALRDRAPSPGTELARVLAAASRVPGHRRIALGPLNLAEVAELVRRETGHEPSTRSARDIHARTAGNPFFVRELSRFLNDGGVFAEDTAAHRGVPATVRDVVRDRMSRLDDDLILLLQIAALLGRGVGIGLLAAVAGVDIPDCLARLEPLRALGLLESAPDDPHSFRYTHDLVRESVAASTPPGRATMLHLRIADALEDSDADDETIAERLAYHLWSAGPLADAARTAEALARAGGCAAAKSALEAAERQLRSAVHIAREAGLAELELSALAQLTAVVGMRSMYGTAAVDLFERAEQLARGLGREVEAAAFLFSRWSAHQQALELDRSGPLARRLLDQGYASSEPMVRTYGLQAWGLHQWDVSNIGEAYRYLSQTESSLLGGLERPEEDPVRGDLELLMLGMLAEITALHGDVPAARDLLDTLESVAGDHPYRVTIWATMAGRIATIVGDPAWALLSAERGTTVDPGFSFVFLGTYQRLAGCWARAVTANDPAAAAAAISEAQRLIAANLLDPPRSCVATWYALLGEMYLTAGSLDDAAAALDRAEFYLDTFGQRYPEGLVLLLRARLLHARGKPMVEVRAAATVARTLSDESEARLFVQRVDRFLAEIG
ncbi:BTAD domain-containing putative transcriptional regulator [Mycolicibacterium sp. Y3]